MQLIASSFLFMACNVAFCVPFLPLLLFVPYSLRDIATAGVYRGSLRFLTDKILVIQ